MLLGPDVHLAGGGEEEAFEAGLTSRYVEHRLQHRDVLPQHRVGALEHVLHTEQRREVDDVGEVGPDGIEGRRIAQVGYHHLEVRVGDERVDGLIDDTATHVVDHHDRPTVVEQATGQVTPDEPGAAGDEHALPHLDDLMR